MKFNITLYKTEQVAKWVPAFFSITNVFGREFYGKATADGFTIVKRDQIVRLSPSAFFSSLAPREEESIVEIDERKFEEVVDDFFEKI